MNLLERVYAQVPDVACKGLCQRACGPIGISAIEADALAAAGIELPTVDSELTCSHLKEGRCSIYANRPLVCRIFGAVKKLPCPHGCKPAGGYLSDVKARELLHAIDDGDRPYHMSELKR